MISKIFKLIKATILNIISKHDQYIFLEDYVIDGRTIIHKSMKATERYNNNCNKVLVTEDGIEIGPRYTFIDYISIYNEENRYFIFTKDYKLGDIFIPKGTIKPMYEDYFSGWIIYEGKYQLFGAESEKGKQYGYII